MTYAQCGTYSGYQRHRRQEEAACLPCRNANANYQRNLRATDPHRQQYDRDQHAAYAAAQARLRKAHPRQFARFYAEEWEARRGVAS